jgi:RNA polymerase sigma-70 factor (ECF subfamily)
VPLPDRDYILKTYSPTIYRLAYAKTHNHADAEDILQDVFLRFLQYESKQGFFESEEHIKAWLIKVTVNRCKTLLGSSWHKKTAPLDENIATQMQDVEDLKPVIAKLPEKYRLVVHLFYYEDLPIAQIAKVLELTESAVKSRLKRAREKLEPMLKEADENV